jgi:hypothetical protein
MNDFLGIRVRLIAFGIAIYVFVHVVAGTEATAIEDILDIRIHRGNIRLRVRCNPHAHSILLSLFVQEACGARLLVVRVGLALDVSLVNRLAGVFVRNYDFALEIFI